MPRHATNAPAAATNFTATKVTVTDNESTAENNLIAFVSNAGTSTGDHALEMDGNLHYNPSSGILTSTAFDGGVTVTVTDNESGADPRAMVFRADDGAGTAAVGLESDGDLYYTPGGGGGTGKLFCPKVQASTFSNDDTLTLLTSSTSDIVLDSDANIEINADGGTISFKDASATLGTITSAGFTGDVVGNVTGTATGNHGFKYLMVSGQSDVVAERSNDELTLVAGSNMTITTNATNDSITFAAAGGGGGNQAGSALYWDSATTFYRYIQGNEILSNDDHSDTIKVEDDQSHAANFGVRNSSASSEAYAIIPIPYGCKAIGYRMNCGWMTTAAATSRTMEVFVVFGDITTTHVDVTFPRPPDGSPTTNADNTFASGDASALTFDSSNPQKTLFLKVNTTQYYDLLIGGWVKFETV